jgi:hypothetical protein
MDVDFCHDSDDPLRRGGLIFHSADHVSGGVSICHEWLAGLLDHYHFTGDMEAREAAVAIGDNILRHLDQPVFRDRPTLTSTRTMGWALRALGPLWVETGDDRYRAACERIAEVFLRRFGQQGGIHDLYTEHNLGRVPFMIALSMESLRQWGEIAHDERIPRLIVDQARDLVDHAVGLGGLMYYKELPSLHVRHENPQALFPLAEAWRSTADPRFLQAAYRIAELMLAGGAREWDVVDKNLFEDALILEGQSWASYQIEPLLHFYAVLSDARDATGAPVLDGLDFRQKF